MESKQRSEANNFRVDTEADIFSGMLRDSTPRFVGPSVRPSIRPSVHLSIRLSVHPSVGLSVMLYFFGGFAVFDLTALLLPK